MVLALFKKAKNNKLAQRNLADRIVDALSSQILAAMKVEGIDAKTSDVGERIQTPVVYHYMNSFILQAYTTHGFTSKHASKHFDYILTEMSLGYSDWFNIFHRQGVLMFQSEQANDQDYAKHKAAGRAAGLWDASFMSYTEDELESWRKHGKQYGNVTLDHMFCTTNLKSYLLGWEMKYHDVADLEAAYKAVVPEIREAILTAMPPDSANER